MSASAFQRWLEVMDLPIEAAARILEIEADLLQRYTIVGAPKVVALACRTVFNRDAPWV